MSSMNPVLRSLSGLALLFVTFVTNLRAEEVVLFDWPQQPVLRELIGYLGSSLAPIRPTPARPTLAERLAHAPFVTGEGRVGLDLTALDAAAASALRAATGADGRLAWAGFGPAADALIGPRRTPRPTLSELRALLQLGQDWESVNVASMLSWDERRLWFNTRRVLETTVVAMETGKPLAFPQETWFLAEHFAADGTVHETHVLSKRADQEWDYLLYDAQGQIQPVSTAINGLRSPTTCFACHRNAGRVPPFKNFPDASDPVNGFLPRVIVTLDPADANIVRKLTRTGPREDHLHGQYGGLAALRVRERIRAGTAPAWAQALWPRLVALVPELGH
jgi:hypothetical protein